MKGTQKPKTYCDNSSFAILSFTFILTVRSGRVWRQDLAILSPEGPRDSTLPCNLCGQLQRRQMPDIENSRKTAETGAKWVAVNSRKTAGKTPETPEKRSKQLFFGCFGCLSGCFSAVLPSPTRHPFRLFFGCFQCRAFGSSVAGRRDCNTCQLRLCMSRRCGGASQSLQWRGFSIPRVAPRVASRIGFPPWLRL